MRRCTPIEPLASPTAEQPWWVNPGAIMTVSTFRITPFTINGATPVAVCKADPKRIGLGFAAGTGLFTGFAVGPTSAPATGGFGFTTAQPWFWFSLFQHGPMVCAGWLAVSSGIVNVSVYEWYRIN